MKTLSIINFILFVGSSLAMNYSYHYELWFNGTFCILTIFFGILILVCICALLNSFADKVQYDIRTDSTKLIDEIWGLINLHSIKGQKACELHVGPFFNGYARQLSLSNLETIKVNILEHYKGVK